MIAVRMAVRLRALAVLAFAVAGCATPVTEQVALLQGTEVCCSHFSQLPSTRLGLPDDRTVELSSRSPVFAFGSGKSFVAAFELPDWQGPYVITIKPLSMSARGGIFSPTLLMLDANYRPGRRITGEGDDALTSSRGITVFVNESDRLERHVLLFTQRTHGEVAGDYTRVVPLQAQVGATPVILGASERRGTWSYAPMGKVRLTVVRDHAPLLGR